MDRKRRVAACLVIASLSSLGVGGAARADAGVDLGLGKDPSVAMASSSFAYVAFNGVESSHPPVHYCEVLNDASTPRCQFAQTLTPPVDTVTPPFVLATAGSDVVRVLTARYGFSSGPFNQTLLYTSAPARAPFGDPVSVGAVSPFGGEAIPGPGGSISITNGASAQHSFQAVPTDGSSAGDGSAALSQSYPYEGSVGLSGQATPVVVSNDGATSPTSAFTVYKGAGSLNDGANWSAPVVVGQGDHGHLAGGPTGLYLMLHSKTGGEHLELRRFDGTSFGAAKPVPGTAASGAESFLVQDPSGELHVLWADGSQLKYTVSDDEGASWLSPVVVATEPRFSGLRAAVGPDNHAGFAVWTADGADGSHVHTAKLAPAAATKPVRAVYSYAPKPFCTGQKITFEGSASQAASQFKIAHYRWDFTTAPATATDRSGIKGGLDYPSKSGHSVTHVFDYTRTGHVNPVKKDPTTGVLHPDGPSYDYFIRDPIRVTLVVTDANGHRDELSRVITFGNDATLVYEDGKVAPAHPGCRRPGPRAHFQVVQRASFTPKSRKVTVPITCKKGPASCIGSIAISLPSGAAPKVRPAARSRALAIKGFLVAPGRTGRVGIKLGKPARKLLLKRHPRRLVVSVKAYGPDGRRIESVRRTVRLVTR